MTVFAHSKIAREQIDAQVTLFLIRAVAADAMRFEKGFERLSGYNRCGHGDRCKNDETITAHDHDGTVHYWVDFAFCMSRNTAIS